MQTTSPSLIGRESDLAALRDALDEACSGVTRAVVVGGEAGIGKTRLLAEFLAEPGDGVLVLRGQCVDLGRDAPPYAPVIAVLRGLLDHVGEPALREAAGPGSAALGVLLPELRAAADEPPVEAAAAGGADRLFDAVATALESASRVQPVVVVIEDLHWADGATLALVRFVLRVLERARILLLLSYRSDELGRGHALRAVIPELDRNRRVSRRELARLGRRQVRQLATALAGRPLDAHDLDTVVRRTDGVPFFVEEIIVGGYDDVQSLPDTLREILLARYETLGDPAQRMLRLLAAGGVRVDHELFAVVAGLAPEAIDELAREAVRARVLEVDDTAYSFRHALVREAVHDELLPGERRRFHIAYAEALESRPGRSADVDATAVSYHWMAAHEITAAFTASLTAMQQARDSFANTSAARMGERALELWEQVADAEVLAGRSRVELLAETAYILRNAGESDRAIALIDEALAGLAEPAPELYARLLRDKASYLANLGHAGSIDLLREALQVLEGRPRSVLRANVLGELSARLMLDARFAESVSTADLAYAEAEAVGSRARMSVAVNMRGVARFSLGEIDEGLADLEAAGRLAEGNDSATLRYRVNQSDVFILLGRYDEAIRVAEAGAEFARARGVERTSGTILMSNVVQPLFALGQTARAEELLDRALELDPPIGFSAHLQRLKLQSTLWAGDVEQAERLVREWRGGLSRQLRIDAQSRLGLAAVAGEIALVAGRTAEAWEEVALIARPEHRRFPAYDLPLIAIAARILAVARATGTALPSPVDELETAVREAGARVAFWPTAEVHLALLDAELGGAAGTGDDPLLWEQAVASAEAPTAPAPLRAYTRLR
ncbi:MAG: AAA family ATPase, partial [Herbiconiux sp.]|nr:AAA family ATPase [Herbiconiux sp.]